MDNGVNGVGGEVKINGSGKKNKKTFGEGCSGIKGNDK